MTLAPDPVLPAGGLPAGRLLLRWAFVLGVLAWVGWQLAQALGPTVAPARVQPELVALALLAVLAHYMGTTLLWTRIVHLLGGAISVRDAFRAIFQANMAKYLPGSLWNLAGRVYLCHRQGLSPAVTTPAVALEAVCQVLSSGLVALAAAPMLAGAPELAPHLALLALAGAGLGLHPRVLNGGFAACEAALARLGRPRGLPRVRVSYGALVALIAAYALNWLVVAAGFAALAQAFVPAPLTAAGLAACGGAFLVAWSAGFLAPFAPAGLGVRDVLLAGLVAQLVPGLGLAGLIAVTCRATMLLADGLCFAVASLLPERRA
ncbi:MAG: lysylphosphatidylglycerol synthase domain-containing protein [Candidatus Sericytochromatia bacterium]|nr:lysylphosphatidylglycerol synthase domain-containing protein [Candidatus Sericytochromatia bacterium]